MGGYQSLLIYAVLRVRILNFQLQNVDNRNRNHDEHENRNPLKRLLCLNLLVQVADRLAKLVDGCMKMLLTDGAYLLRAVVSYVACTQSDDVTFSVNV